MRFKRSFIILCMLFQISTTFRTVECTQDSFVSVNISRQLLMNPFYDKTITNCSIHLLECPSTEKAQKYRELCLFDFSNETCPVGQHYYCGRDNESVVLVEGCFQRKTCPKGTSPKVSYNLNTRAFILRCLQCEEDLFQPFPVNSSSSLTGCTKKRYSDMFSKQMPKMVLVKVNWPYDEDVYSCNSKKGYSNLFGKHLCSVTSPCYCTTAVHCSNENGQELLPDGTCDNICIGERGPFNSYKCDRPIKNEKDSSSWKAYMVLLGGIYISVFMLISTCHTLSQRYISTAGEDMFVPLYVGKETKELCKSKKTRKRNTKEKKRKKQKARRDLQQMKQEYLKDNQATENTYNSDRFKRNGAEKSRKRKDIAIFVSNRHNLKADQLYRDPLSENQALPYTIATEGTLNSLKNVLNPTENEQRSTGTEYNNKDNGLNLQLLNTDNCLVKTIEEEAGEEETRILDCLLTQKLDGNTSSDHNHFIPVKEMRDISLSSQRNCIKSLSPRKYIKLDFGLLSQSHLDFNLDFKYHDQQIPKAETSDECPTASGSGYPEDIVSSEEDRSQDLTSPFTVENLDNDHRSTGIDSSQQQITEERSSRVDDVPQLKDLFEREEETIVKRAVNYEKPPKPRDDLVKPIGQTHSDVNDLTEKENKIKAINHTLIFNSESSVSSFTEQEECISSDMPSSFNSTTANDCTNAYGSDGTTANASTSVYGSDGTTANASTSVYGSDGTTANASTSVYESYSTTANASTSVYGSNGTTANASTSIYVSNGTTANASTSVYGSDSTTANASSSVYENDGDLMDIKEETHPNHQEDQIKSEQQIVDKLAFDRGIIHTNKSQTNSMGSQCLAKLMKPNEANTNTKQCREQIGYLRLQLIHFLLKLKVTAERKYFTEHRLVPYKQSKLSSMFSRGLVLQNKIVINMTQQFPILYRKETSDLQEMYQGNNSMLTLTLEYCQKFRKGPLCQDKLHGDRVKLDLKIARISQLHGLSKTANLGTLMGEANFLPPHNCIGLLENASCKLQKSLVYSESQVKKDEGSTSDLSSQSSCTSSSGYGFDYCAKEHDNLGIEASDEAGNTVLPSNIRTRALGRMVKPDMNEENCLDDELAFLNNESVEYGFDHIINSRIMIPIESTTVTLSNESVNRNNKNSCESRYIDDDITNCEEGIDHLIVQLECETDISQEIQVKQYEVIEPYEVENIICHNASLNKQSEIIENKETTVQVEQNMTEKEIENTDDQQMSCLERSSLFRTVSDKCNFVEKFDNKALHTNPDFNTESCMPRVVKSLVKKFNKKLSNQRKSTVEKRERQVMYWKRRSHRGKMSCKSCHRKLLHTNPVCGGCIPRRPAPEIDDSVLSQQNMYETAVTLSSSLSIICASRDSIISLTSDLNNLQINLNEAIMMNKSNRSQLKKKVLDKEKELFKSFDTLNRELRSDGFVQNLRSWRYFRPDPLQVDLDVFPRLHDYFQRVEQGPISREESMNYEWIRLSSLSSYRGAGSAIQLAKHGFYQDPEHGPLATRCYACQLLYTNWEYFDNIEDKHRRLSPNCPLVCNNEPTPQRLSNDNSSDRMIPPATVEAPQVTTALRTTESVTNVTDAMERTKIRDMVPEGFPTQPTEDGFNSEYICSSLGTTAQAAVFCKPKTESPARSDQCTNNTDTCTTNNNVSQSQSNAISRSEPSDADKIRERLQGNAKNAKAGLTGEQSDTTVTGLNNPQLVVVMTPKHSEYTSIDTRSASFTAMWPSYLDQIPRAMAEAGFFYTGAADFTRCFACGGCLKNWEAGEDPCFEHTRWFPGCEYMNKLKGTRYVQAVIRRQEQHLAEQRQRKNQQQEQRRKAVSPNTPRDPLTTLAGLVLLEMGYTRARVSEAIVAVRRNTGNNSVNAEQAMMWILDKDEQAASTASAETSSTPLLPGQHTLQTIPTPTPSTPISPIEDRRITNGPGTLPLNIEVQFIGTRPIPSRQQRESSTVVESAPLRPLPEQAGADSGSVPGNPGLLQIQVIENGKY